MGTASSLLPQLTGSATGAVGSSGTVYTALLADSFGLIDSNTFPTTKRFAGQVLLDGAPHEADLYLLNLAALTPITRSASDGSFTIDDPGDRSVIPVGDQLVLLCDLGTGARPLAHGPLTAVDVPVPPLEPMTTLFIGTDWAYATRVDISNPDAIYISDAHLFDANWEEILSVSVSDDGTTAFACIDEEPDRVGLLDISSPTGVSITHTLQDGEGGATLWSAQTVCVDWESQLAYVALGISQTISIVDFSDPAAMTEVSTISDATYFDDVEDLAVDTEAQVLYTICSDNGAFTAVDVSNPASPQVLGSHIPARSTVAWYRTFALDTAAQVAFIVDRAGEGIVAIDISDPTTLSELGTFFDASLDTPCRVRLDVDTSILFVACYGTQSLAAVDVSNPAGMSILGTFTDPDFSNFYEFEFDPVSKTAYLLEGSSIDGVIAVDVSNPAAMVERSRVVGGDALHYPYCVKGYR